MELIIYIDMNAFFASCHQIQNPQLKNKSVVVASASRRAVVCSASYQARAFGIKSGMPLYQAKNLCPDAIYINTNHNLYRSYSEKILTFLRSNFTSLVAQYSIDEYCLDISNFYKKYGSAVKCAQFIQEQLLKTFDLPCSIGISFTIDLAKIASKLKKPQGIAIIMAKDLPKVLFPLPIAKLNGIGPKTTIQLQNLKINTINDLVKYQNPILLDEIFGKRYWSWVKQAIGKTTNKIADSCQIAKSIGRDTTLEYDSNDQKYLETILKQLTKQVVAKALQQQVTIKTIVCGYKVERQHWVTKQMTLTEAFNKKTVDKIVKYLFLKIWNAPTQVRALRVALKIKD